ncbi:MAG: DUF2169 domain-containing protein [Desulfobacteraceae bacterium]|nr:MAG: DUF2169 domain-containing protein [Desulfobacteraceae bacterium]
MKVFKKNEHSLLIKPFGLRGRIYLACTALLYFDLRDPDKLLREQELWSTVPALLGQGSGLDAGMPKERGEFLVLGKCFASRGTRRTSSEVSVRVGSLEKRLLLFGNRYWMEGGGSRVFTDPSPFAEIPLLWENGFGGKGYERNPVGKGIHPIPMQDGRSLVPLPNIEDPSRLIVSPDDRPEPSGLAPLDPMWPQRFRKQGTYDDKWKRERWPHFPDDMNYEFFNTAPDDQFLPDFFQGEEVIEIRNMHPDHQVIVSRIPAAALRCFVTKIDPQAEGDIFEEVKTRIDTLWLFPEILRGIVVFRGTTEIRDEEYGDVRSIYLATEMKSDIARSVEYYADAQKKVLNLSVPMDPAPLSKAREKIGDALKRIRAIPKEVESAKLKAMGKAPVMPRTPAEMAQKAETMIQSAGTLLTRIETRAKSMQSRWGHRARIPVEEFDPLRAGLEKTGRTIREAAGEIEAAKRDAGDAGAQKIERFKSKASAGEIKKVGADLESLFPTGPLHPWQDRGFEFAVRCRKALENDRESQERLFRLGLRKRTIREAWLGIHAEEERERKIQWGLDPSGGDSMILPAGLVIPRFHEATIEAICIRPGEYADSNRDLLIEGSDRTPLFLTGGRKNDAPVVRVADDLQALFLEQEIGDACSVTAIADPGEKPGKEATEAIESAMAFLIVLPEGALDSEFAPWQKTYPKASKCVLTRGRSLFEACEKGVDIRQWIMEALPGDFAEEYQVTPHTPEAEGRPKISPLAGLPIPHLDMRSLISGAMSEIRAVHQPSFDALTASRKQMEEKARKAIREAGGDPEKIIPPMEKEMVPDFARAGEERARGIAGNRDALRAAGTLDLETEKRMNEAETLARNLGHDAQDRYEKGMARLNEGLKKASAIKGEGLKEDEPSGFGRSRRKKRSREEVIEMHGRGESLSGAVVSGVDLSNLDLRGLDLNRALCRKTNFSGSNLDGADLRQVIAQGADFSGASLKTAGMVKGIFSDGSFKRADLGAADLTRAVFKGADLEEAVLAGCRLYMTILQKAILKKTTFSDANAEMSLFSGADASDARFTGARLIKCLFQRTILDRVDFSDAVLSATMLYGAKGVGVIFRGADLSKCRMGGQAAMPQADFTNMRMIQGCFRDSDLSKASFRGAELQSAMFENCDLQHAEFYRVPAGHTRFSKCNLEGANMHGINLFQGSLRKARLVNTDLTGSNLYAVDLYKAVMGDTRLEGANLKMTLLHERKELLPK